MNFPNSIIRFERFSPLIGTVFRSVINVVKRFTRNRGYVTAANRKRFRRLETEWEFLRRPTKRQLSKVAPYWPRRNFGSDDSKFVVISIHKFDVNIAIGFNLHTYDATR